VSVAAVLPAASNKRIDIMPIYIIAGTKVTASSALPVNLPEGSIAVRSVEELQKAALSGADLAALWNAMPGTIRIAKFANRRSATQRLWAAFGKLTIVEPAAARRRKVARDAQREGRSSKQDQVIALLRRPEGATIEALMAATGWQRHTVRGAIAGALKKKLGLAVLSEKSEAGRLYRIAG
jgi:hypothetical protein